MFADDVRKCLGNWWATLSDQIVDHFRISKLLFYEYQTHLLILSPVGIVARVAVLASSLAVMGTDFEIAVTLPLPRLALWYLRGTARFHAALVSQGALSRMMCGPVYSVAGTGASAEASEYVYVPKEMEIPDAVKSVFNDTFLEIRDVCAWDDGLCEEDDRHKRGEGDLCLARAGGLLAQAGEGKFGVGEKGARLGAEENAGGADSEALDVGKVKVANGMRRCYSQNFVITPGVMSEYVTTTGSLSLYEKEDDDMSCQHVLRGQCEVGIPLVGWYVESAIIQNMNTFYKSYEGHIARVRDELLGNSSTKEMVQKARVVYEEDLEQRKMATSDAGLNAVDRQKHEHVVKKETSSA